MTEQSTTSTDQSLRGRIKQKFCVHEWSYLWSKREKTCVECGAIQEITKEYTHDDESAEIGDTRVIVDKNGDSYSIDKQRYRCTGHGEDKAYFKWFPAEYITLTGSQAEELREELNRSVLADTDHSGGDDDASM